MTQGTSPQQKRGLGAHLRRDKLLDLLFVILNFVLSGPPSWQRTPQKSAQQRKSSWRFILWWGAILGVPLGILYASAFYFGMMNSTSNVFNNQPTGFLLYVLLIFLLFFLVGLLRGRATGSSDAGIGIAAIACLIQALTSLVLYGIYSVAFNFWSFDHSGVVFALFGIDIESGGLGAGYGIMYTQIFQLPLGMLDAYIGGAIGRRL